MSNISLIGKVVAESFLSRIRPRIRHLILHVTNRCNMRCRHCFVDFNDPDKELDFREIKEISKRVPDLIWLDIGGGEPFLRDDLEDVISLFNFRELSIPTNGWLTGRIIEKVKKINLMSSGKLIITLSLDGMQKTHDEIRHPDAFERTIETCKRLKEIEGLRIKFNTVLCERNCGEIIDLMNFVRTLNPDFHSVLLLRGLARDPSMQLPSLERIKTLEKDIFRIQQSYNYGRTGILSRIQKNYQRYKRDISLKTLGERKQVIPCLAGKSHLVIWPSGDVSPCELLPPIGNLRDTQFEGLMKCQEMQRAVSDIRNGCCYCTHDCNMIENILFNPISYTQLLYYK